MPKIQGSMSKYQILESAFKKIHEDINKDLPADIYHYTSFNGLENILKQRKLIYTDYRFFNDPTEIEYGKKLILHALIRDERIDRKIVQMIMVLFSNLESLYKIYVCCFSMQIEKLALWRYYACNGSGCAIHFNNNFSKIENSDNPIGKSAFCSVVYGDERSLQIVNKFTEAVRDINPSEDHDLIVMFISHLISIIPMLKDKSFEEESEVRIYYPEGELVKNSNKMPFYFDDKDRDFIPMNRSYLPFLHQIQGNKPVITTDEFCKKDIRAIWIGPACDFIEARSFVRKLLIDNCYDISDIEIRSCLLPYKAR